MCDIPCDCKGFFLLLLGLNDEHSLSIDFDVTEIRTNFKESMPFKYLGPNLTHDVAQNFHTYPKKT